jgi:hypothetical protein
MGKSSQEKTKWKEISEQEAKSLNQWSGVIGQK